MGKHLVCAAACFAFVTAGAAPLATRAWQPVGTPRLPSAVLFSDTCAGCHGADLSGGRAPSLFSERLLAERSDEALHRTIRDGRPDAGMPAFGEVLSDAQIWQVVAYLRTRGAALKGKPAWVADPRGQVIRSSKQTFRIDVVAAGLEVPWGMAFLPDGRMLVTERPGRLRILKDGKLHPTPVRGTPRVWVRQDAGLLDVAVHPDYRRNGWIYLAYTDTLPRYHAPTLKPGEIEPSPPSMTVVVRGRLNARNEWVDSREIFRAPASLYTTNGSHYGCRFTFDQEGRLYFTLGDRGEMAHAQDLSSPLGKIHRVNADGSIPADNPFVDTPGAVPSIWTLGNRNPQGLAWDPVTGLLWEAEHGPMGGDEINIVEKGRNYGWGVVSMGVQPGITKRSAPGMEPPVAYYLPSIAPSGIAFYSGDRYPGWKNNLFVAGLSGQQLRRLEVRGREVVAQEVLFQQFGRTRAVTTGPDGLLYVLIQNPTGMGTGIDLTANTPGMIIRLQPLPGR